MPEGRCPRGRILNITKFQQVTGPATLPLRYARAMAARAPPAARLALDTGFDKIKDTAFDGTNFEDYAFTLETALTSCPAAVAILKGDLTRPHVWHAVCEHIA